MAALSGVEGPLAEAMVTGPVALSDFLIVLPVVVPMLFGAMLICLRKSPQMHAAIALPGFLLLLGIDLRLLIDVSRSGPRTMMMGAWKAPFGIAFTLDLTGALFLAASGFVALACAIHACASVPGIERRYGFFAFHFMMMAGVSGAFLTGDIFNLYVWFEVLLIASFGLIVLGSSLRQLDGAIKYCFLNLIATTLFLVATGLLYGLFGTLNMAEIARLSSTRGIDPAALSIAVLYLLAFGMKAAAFPLNAWLPASYHTPRIVVSALFAGLLTKVGIYALIRVLVMLFPLQRGDLAPVIAWVAGLTMIVGALGALAQSDIRKLLNHVIIAGIGTILAGIAIPGAAGLDPTAREAAGEAMRTGLAGAIVYALQSMLVMTALYLAVGAIVSRAGTSSLHGLGGLWRAAPGLSALTLLLFASAAGLPPFPGFWPKVMLLRATLGADMPWLAGAIVVSAFLLTVGGARFAALALWRDSPGELTTSAAEDGLGLSAEADGRLVSLSIMVLTGAALAIGLFPEWLTGLATRAAVGLIDPSAYIQSVLGKNP